MKKNLLCSLAWVWSFNVFGQAIDRRDKDLNDVQKKAFLQNKTEVESRLNEAIAFLKSEKILIRKTFDATSKDEEKPASFLWNSDFENSLHYLTADIGIKSKDFQPFKGSLDLLLFSPKFEWHRDNTPKEDKKKNNIGAGLSLSLVPFQNPNRKLKPFLTGSIDYKKDFIKDLQTFSAKGYLSAVGDTSPFPGAMIRAKINPIFRYYPYLGYEYYADIQTSRSSAHLLIGRYFAEFFPVPPLADHLQLTFEYTGRFVISNTLYEKREGVNWTKWKNLPWLSVGVNCYLNSDQNIGIGVDYSKGYDPTSNFVKTDKIAFGLKLKF